MSPNLLTIAGSDPSGGAGIQADLKTFSALGCYGMAAITALTAQNTQSVFAVHEAPHDFVARQIEVLFDDIRIDAVKIGMAGSVQAIGAIAEILQSRKPAHIVLDTVMVAQSGDALLSNDAIDTMRKELLPLASIITPNIPEAEILLGKSLSDGFDSNAEKMALALLDLGCPAVLLKGGHLTGDQSNDIYAHKDGRLQILASERIETNNNHGTGCTLSSALACYLAKGLPMDQAAEAAKKYITNALSASDDLNIGKGAGPVHHFHSLW